MTKPKAERLKARKKRKAKLRKKQNDAKAQKHDNPKKNWVAGMEQHKSALMARVGLLGGEIELRKRRIAELEAQIESVDKRIAARKAKAAAKKEAAAA